MKRRIPTIRHALPCSIPRCKEPPHELVYVPKGCACLADPLQALCPQHLISMMPIGAVYTLARIRP